ncbi:multicopper oxidase family protein [Actinomadura gamaensis]|uniref:Multicopper oxidase CueO n=1 Tax=Actinomadura gamaensis TaxID=1763541 RepID=A0ABV9TWU5_9ACTN
MVTRRQFVLGGAATAATVVLYNAHTAQATGSMAGHAGHTGGLLRAGSRLTTAPFTVQMPVPGVLRPTTSTSTTDYYDITVKPGVEELVPGVSSGIFGYNGTFTGPTIRAWQGRQVVVRQTNRLDRPISTHLHGGHVAAADDGHPMDVIAPGGSKTYHYPNDQFAATLWYHDHAHHVEAENLFKGLAGFYLISSPDEQALNLPRGAYDVPIMLRDVRMADDGTLNWVMDDFANRLTILANGRNQPRFPVQARKYRFRFLNASNLRPFGLGLADGSTLTMIGADQSLLPAPDDVTSFELWPGERYDVVIDFSRYRVGDQIMLTNSMPFPNEGDAQKQILRFDVVGTASDSSDVPDELADAPSLPAATNTRRIQLGPFDPPSGTMVIDGKTYDGDRIDQTVPLGATEIWEIYNADTQYGLPHNFHMHLVHFKVLDRNGTPPPAAEQGWRDTVTVHPGETVRVQATFADHRGTFVYHCHLIDHASMGMMAQFQVV